MNFLKVPNLLMYVLRPKNTLELLSSFSTEKKLLPLFFLRYGKLERVQNTYLPNDPSSFIFSQHVSSGIAPNLNDWLRITLHCLKKSNRNEMKDKKAENKRKKTHDFETSCPRCQRATDIYMHLLKKICSNHAVKAQIHNILASSPWSSALL